MRVSEYYNLRRTQPTLDFVDVDIFGDACIFIDPRALRLLPSRWGDECVALIQDYFHKVLQLIRSREHDNARELLSTLREPNETHLGLSKRRAIGHALGDDSARNVWNKLRQSVAVQSGLLVDLEDTILMVEGVASDIISDITTNIIREPLIRYTQSVAALYSIPLQQDVDSGPLWDPSRQSWYNEYVELPVTNYGKLLLVPKAIVRRNMDYSVNEYYNNYIIDHLRQTELNANTELVRTLRDGRRRVTKKDLVSKYGSGKSVVIRETRSNPELLRRYRSDKRNTFTQPLDHIDLAETEGTQRPNWDEILNTLLHITPGREDANEYENAIESLLSATFYPFLTNPQKQVEIHYGRKRIDLTYTNIASRGFFHWLSQNYPAPHIFVECKNYTSDIGNPELDQLAGRFSPSRGKFGIIVCRTFENKELFIARCRDTANDQRGFIIPLDDQDITELVNEQRTRAQESDFQLLRERFNRLIF